MSKRTKQLARWPPNFFIPKPEPYERTFPLTTKELRMATATKKKPTKKSAKKRDKKKSAVSMGNTDHNPDQSQLDGFEEERIPEIETAVASIVAAGIQKKELEDRISEQVAELAEMLREHEIKEYKCCGRQITLVPGEESVKIKKAKKTKHES